MLKIIIKMEKNLVERTDGRTVTKMDKYEVWTKTMKKSGGSVQTNLKTIKKIFSEID